MKKKGEQKRKEKSMTVYLHEEMLDMTKSNQKLLVTPSQCYI
jgi:hypothetical protein